MPTMFSRRRGVPGIQPMDPSTTAAATTAATSAFLQKSLSNASLSSAAAAAALRSHTTSPEAVGSIQTKRMVRRGSTSSTGSGGVPMSPSGRPGLQRANSNGSMTERTFRTSLRQPNGRIPPGSPGSDVPAVTALGSLTRKRSSSLEAPQRLTSPTPAQGKRGSSADETIMAPPGTSRQAKRLSNVAEAEEVERVAASSPAYMSRSIPPPQNRSVSLTTGAAKKYTHGMGSWFTQGSVSDSPFVRPAPADGMRSYSLGNPRPNIALAAGSPVKKNRISAAPGSHLAQANQNPERTYQIRPGTAYEGPQATLVYDPNTRMLVHQPGGPPKQGGPPSPESSKRDEVYDPNTRSFVPRSQTTRNDSATAHIQPEPQLVPIPTPSLKAKKQRPIVPAVDTALEPLPRNPARLSPVSSSPTSPRAPPILHKQPSVVREEPEAEQLAEESSAKPAETKDISQAVPTLLPAKTYVAATTPHQRSASLDVPSLGRDALGRGRNASHSPQRSARFSPSPVLEALRHDPPPRDLSPAKSALKHSPASSMRASSPIAIFTPSSSAAVKSPPSETSESPSLGSQDGLNVKRKKSVRVSFDEKTQEIDSPSAYTSAGLDRPAAAPDDLDDDAIMKPRPALPSFGSVRKNRVQPELAEKVTETPPERHGVSTDLAIGGILRDSFAGTDENEPLPPEVTSKEIAGYVSDASSEADVPAVNISTPEPTRTEDQRDVTGDSGEPKIRDFAEMPTKQDGEQSNVENQDVPAIALLPPTPGTEGESNMELGHEEDRAKARVKWRNSMEGFTVPGSWGRDEEDDEDDTAEPAKLDESPSAEDSATTQTLAPIQMTHTPQQLSDADEDSDDSAAFSDAVEDPSDFEDETGFASLDAIVESPNIMTPEQAEAKTVDSSPESPLTKQTAKKMEMADASLEPEGDKWDAVTAHWSRLSKEKRQQIEREHLSSDDEMRPAPLVVPVKKTKAQKMPTTGQQSTKQPAQSAMRKSMRAQPGPVPTDDGVHMRRSMRDGPSARAQPEYVEPRGALQKKYIRPMSGGVAASSAGTATRSNRPQSPAERTSQDPSVPTLRTKRDPQRARQELPLVSERLQRELAQANDSDSESSFKRRRRGPGPSNADSQGRFRMKRSMRSGSLDQPADPGPAERRPVSPTETRGKGSFSLRPLSPPRLFSRSRGDGASSPEVGMRTTLRRSPASQDGGRTRLGASGPSRPTKAPAAASDSRFKSRFVDSDDEDEADVPKRSLFKSRFADSDDEDEPGSPGIIPADLTPVRGIPRRRGRDDGDSTDLEDEDEDGDPGKASGKRGKLPKTLVGDPAEVERVMAIARRNLGLEDSAPPDVKEGDALQKGTLRQTPAEYKPEPASKPADISFALPEKKRRGFMGGILRRNRNSSSSVQQVGPSSPTRVAPPPAAGPASPDATGLEPPAGPPSPSPGRLIRRTSNQPKLERANSDLPTTAADGTTVTALPQIDRKDSDAVPLPPPPKVTADGPGRPNTSDGFSPEAIRLARTMRPDLAPRSNSGQPLGARVKIQAGEEGSEPGEREPRVVYSQRTGRKKKFGMLRRAFGLND